MVQSESGGVWIELDGDGFVINPDDWDEDVARAMAHDDSIPELTEDHWRIIRYVRSYYASYGVAPMIRRLCKDTGYPLRQVYELFPKGPVWGACRIAGLPKPVGCV